MPCARERGDLDGRFAAAAQAQQGLGVGDVGLVVDEELGDLVRARDVGEHGAHGA